MKVVKRGVRERLHVSSMVFNVLLTTAQALVPPLRAYDLPAHFAQMRPLLTGQTDILREAAVQMEIADNGANGHVVPLDVSAIRDILRADLRADLWAIARQLSLRPTSPASRAPAPSGTCR